MANRIKNLEVWTSRLDPAEAELLIFASPEQVSSTTEIRGRLTGPHCVYASTVEVAYPLRELTRQYDGAGLPRIISRVLIPEPNLWDPQSPFLYQGRVELWHDGERCDHVDFKRGFRTIRRGRQGWLLNGQRVTVQGVACADCSEEQARHLHDGGYNTLLLPVTEQVSQIADRGDRYGLLILGRLSSKDQLGQAGVLARHTSFLGWLVDAAFLEQFHLMASPGPPATVVPSEDLAGEIIAGIEVTKAAVPTSLPAGISFVACGEELRAALEGIPLPKLLLDSDRLNEPVAADILGRIGRQRPSHPDLRQGLR